MAYSPKNAVKNSGGNSPQILLLLEEIIQGVLDNNQQALRANIQVAGSDVSASNPLFVTVDAPAAGVAFSDASPLTITAGGTAQTIFTANAARVYLFVLNTSDTIMYLEVTGAAATSASIPLQPGTGFYEPALAPGAAISLLCATTGKTFVAKQA